MTSLIDEFPALNNLPEYHAFVTALHTKETEDGITVRKLRTWVGSIGMEITKIRNVLFTDSEWKKDSGWRRRLLARTMTVRLPGSRAPRTVRAVLRSALVEGIPFSEVCARVRRVDPATKDEHIQRWLDDERERPEREAVPSVAPDGDAGLSDGDGDATIPLSDLEEMSRAPRTERTVPRPRGGSGGVHPSATAPPSQTDPPTATEASSDIARAIQAGTSIEWIKEFRLFEAQRTETEARRAEAESNRAEAEARGVDAEAQRTQTEAKRAEVEAKRAEAEDKRRLAEEAVAVTRRIELDIARLQREPQALEPGPAPAPSPRRRRAPKRPRESTAPPPSSERAAGVDGAAALLAQTVGAWRNMECLSRAVWMARPPTDDRTLAAVFAAVEARVQTMRKPLLWTVRYLNTGSDAGLLRSVYVNHRFDINAFVETFWEVGPRPPPTPPPSTAGGRDGSDASGGERATAPVPPVPPPAAGGGRGCSDDSGAETTEPSPSPPTVPRRPAPLFLPNGGRSAEDEAAMRSLRDGPLRPLTWSDDVRRFFETALPPAFLATHCFESLAGPSPDAQRILRVPDRSGAAERFCRTIAARTVAGITIGEALTAIGGSAMQDSAMNFAVARLLDRRWRVGRTADGRCLYRADALPAMRCAAAVLKDLGTAGRAALDGIP